MSILSGLPVLNSSTDRLDGWQTFHSLVSLVNLTLYTPMMCLCKWQRGPAASSLSWWSEGGRDKAGNCSESVLTLGQIVQLWRLIQSGKLLRVTTLAEHFAAKQNSIGYWMLNVCFSMPNALLIDADKTQCSLRGIRSHMYQCSTWWLLWMTLPKPAACKCKHTRAFISLNKTVNQRDLKKTWCSFTMKYSLDFANWKPQKTIHKSVACCTHISLITNVYFFFKCMLCKCISTKISNGLQTCIHKKMHVKWDLGLHIYGPKICTWSPVY